MVLYVVYRASKESKNRSLLPPRLKALGCQQLQRSFWKIDERQVPRVLKILQRNQPILLRKVREIRRPRYANAKGISELGSLVIVTYAAPKEVKREKIKNFMRRAPCIRLCRSVYAFSQNHTLFDKENELVDAFKFATFIRGIQEHVKVIPRVAIVNRNSNERLLKEVVERIEGQTSGIIRCSKELYGKILNGDDLRPIRDLHSRNKRRFMSVKKLAAFYEKWLGLEMTRSLMKAYKAVKKVDAILKRTSIHVFHALAE